MNPHIFREYDIRGRVDPDLSPDVVRGIGRAYGSVLPEGARVAVGMDVRDTSPAVETPLVEGLLDAGVNVVRLGAVPTPTLYYAVHHRNLDGGIQVTGSHNPIEYNGLKMMRGKGSFFGREIQDLRSRIEAGTFREGAVGELTAWDPRESYLTDLLSRISLDRPLRVGLDAGNGAAWEAAPRLFRALGCEVVELYCEADGSFPNHMPDPTLPETLVDLQRAVVEQELDLGLAYDGDADRLGALDDTGRIVWGDQLLALFARQVLAVHPGAPVLFEVKCSQALIEDIEAHGGEPVMVPTGHSIIKREMATRGALLAGEMSGHLFFADQWYGFDDAIYASGRLAALVAAGGERFSALVDTIPRYHATPEIRIDCPDALKFEVVAGVLGRYRGQRPVVDVDGARIGFETGWGLIRASNTQPVLVLRAEGTTPQARDRIETELRACLRDLGVDPGAGLG